MSVANGCGVAQRQSVGLITRKMPVQFRPPLPGWGVVEWEDGGLWSPSPGFESLRHSQGSKHRLASMGGRSKHLSKHPWECGGVGLVLRALVLSLQDRG